MERVVQVFRVGLDGATRPEGELTITGDDVDAVVARTRQSLEVGRNRVRCVSFTPTGLVAYVEQPK